MTNLNSYLQDGANYQARAVLMFLQIEYIEESYNNEHKRYDAEIKVGRWGNCREQGYIVSLVNKKRKQLNIAFFEHRNSDEICAVKWEQKSTNILTIDTAIFEDVYSDKYDVSYSVKHSNVCEMADWIRFNLKDHYKKS